MYPYKSSDIVTYEPGALIIGPALGSEDPGRIGHLEAGIVRQTGALRSAQSKTVTLNFFGAGHWFGLESTIGGHNFCSYFAATDVRAYLAEAGFLQENPKMQQALFAQLAREKSFLEFNIILRKKPLRVRILYLLQYLRERIVYPEIAMTQTDIADLAGSDPGKVGPILKDLESSSLIQKGYRNYLIGPREALIQAIQKELF